MRKYRLPGFDRRCRLVGVASGIVAAVAIAAPATATALPAEAGNSIWLITNAVVNDDGHSARLAVLYQCDSGAEATITVRLFQDDARRGERSIAATCIGKPLSANLDIESVGSPWAYGESTAFMDITDNVGDSEQAHKIKMGKPLRP